MIRRTTIVLIEVLAGLLAVILVLTGLGAWRLSQGPIDLGFLTPSVVGALSDPDSKIRVEIGSTVLTWAGWSRALEIHARDVRVLGEDGAVLASAPELDMDLSLRALAAGRIAPTALDMLGATLNVRRDLAGRFELEVGGGAHAAGESLPSLLGNVLGSSDSTRPLGLLRSLRIRDSTVRFEDLRSKRSWEATIRLAQASRETAGVRFSADLDVVSGGDIGFVSIEALQDFSTGGAAVSIGFRDLVPSRLAELSPDLVAARAIEAPLEGRVAFSLAADGRVPEIELKVSAKPGRIEPGAAFPGGIAIAGGALDAVFTDNLAKLVVRRIYLDLGEPKIEATAEAETPFGRAAFIARGTVKGVPLSKLGEWWPKGTSPGGRAWMIANMNTGMARETNFELAGRAGPGVPDGMAIDRVEGQIRFDGATVRYIKKMPVVRDVAGVAAFTLKGLDIQLKSGAVKNLAVSEGVVKLSGLDTTKQFADIDLKIAGPLRDALELIDGEPLYYARRVNIAPQDVEGAAVIKLNVHLPLIDALAIDQVRIAADADVTRMSWKKAMLERDAKDGTLNIKVDNRAMAAQGQISLGETVWQIRWSEQFQTAAESSRLEMVGNVSDAGRLALGLDLGSLVAGPVGARAVIVSGGRTQRRLTAELNLAAAEMRVDEIDWRKAAGVEGRARVTAEFGAAPPAAVFFDGAGGGFSARGQARLGQGGKGVRELAFDALVLGRTDARGTVTFRPDGGYGVQLSGNSIDASFFIGGAHPPEGAKKSTDKDAKKAPPQPQKKADKAPFDLRLEAKRLWLGSDRAIDQARVALARERIGWRLIDVEGRLGKDAKAFKMRYAQAPGAYRDLVVNAEDAGETLRVFGIVETASGGKLEAWGREDTAEAPLKGELKLKDFRVKDAPFLARILTLASLTGLFQSLSGEGLLFDRFTAPFSLARGVAEVKSGSARSADLGLTFEGKIDFDAETVDMQGLVIPAYTFNSIISNIPILGHVLAGGPGGGVFAGTFSMRGPFDDPKIGVNPLAALTPGILRNVFSIFDGGGGGESTGPLPGRRGEGQ
ncbi:MAG: AsmA-like C-terminal domain-containing protein [Alphaproteobacteria bacterium]